MNCDDTTDFDVDQTRPLTAYGKFAPIYCMVDIHEPVSYLMKENVALCLNMVLFHCKFVDTLLEEPVTHSLISELFDHLEKKNIFTISERTPTLCAYDNHVREHFSISFEFIILLKCIFIFILIN